MLYIAKELNYKEWSSYFKECNETNMLQCWQYGTAKQQSGKLNSIRFLIVDEDNNPKALVQVLIRNISFVGGLARVNRGPILIGDRHGESAEKVSLKAIIALINEAKKRWWWLIQIAPDMIESNDAVNILKKIGLKKLLIEPSASGLLSLDVKADDLLMDLKGKWRNCLRKGLRLGINVTTTQGHSSELGMLLKRYNYLQTDNGFAGLPDSLILSLAKQKGDEWQFTLFIANEKGKDNINDCVGMLVSIRHGDTSTYLIGSTDKKGRLLQVNYVLLWESILLAKNNGCKWFDIGGLNKTTPKGIAHFKKGLNSELYSLIGEWRGIIFPWKNFTNTLD